VQGFDRHALLDLRGIYTGLACSSSLCLLPFPPPLLVLPRWLLSLSITIHRHSLHLISTSIAIYVGRRYSPHLHSLGQQSTPSMLTCPECGQRCKNSGGLTRHQNSAHNHDPGLNIPVTELQRVYHPHLNGTFINPIIPCWIPQF
jgi:uncharacterized C2H2 Zn-finger protein